MSKYREGSMGAGDDKAEKIMAIASSVVAVLVFLVLFVFKNDLSAAVKPVAGILKVIGGISVLGSGVAIWAARAFSWTGKTGGWAWFLCLLFGFLFSTGFLSHL